MSAIQTRISSAKVNGVVITETGHPEIFAGNPAMQTLARIGGGNLVLSEAQFSALGGRRTNTASYGTTSGTAAPQATVPNDDGAAFADAYFAAKREARTKTRR